jgi:hypothetical protein
LGTRGLRPGNGHPEEGGQSPHGQVVVDGPGLEAPLHGQSGQQRLDQHGQVVGFGHRARVHRGRPAGQAAGRVLAGFGIPLSDHPGDLVVTCGPKPQLLLE